MPPKKKNKKRASPRGRRVSPAALDEVRALLGDAPRRRDLLIEHLHLIQDRYRCISDAHLVALAAEMKLAPTEVYEVASFYHHFDVVKDGAAAPPAVTVRVCDSVSCALAGCEKLIAALENEKDFRVQRVPCVGRCDAAPVAVVGQNPVAEADAGTVRALAVQKKTAVPRPDGSINLKQYRAGGGYQLAADVAAGKLSAEKVIAMLDESGLRGLGGAGFPAGRKWNIVRAQPAPRLMAVNIDEGEPGTFKDRFYLERDPHRFLEGMLVAAHAVDIAEIYIYVRDEYPACLALLRESLDALAASPPCTLPQIHLRRGAGAYICGEESAMIESIEGKRGMPRLRPPFVAEVGLFGRPTLEHNFETLFRVRDIVEKGPQWFTSHGRRGRKGLLSFSVSGRVRKPGVYEAPAGISARELIQEYCGGMADGHEFYGYFPGGASGGILPAALGDVPLDFDTLHEHGCFIGSAAVIVLSHQDSARAAALNAMKFFSHESCGKCTPCRVGTAKAAMLMKAKTWDQPLLEELAQTMADASICGLGQAAPNPMRCVVKYFSEELI